MFFLFRDRFPAQTSTTQVNSVEDANDADCARVESRAVGHPRNCFHPTDPMLCGGPARNFSADDDRDQKVLRPWTAL